jgi:hypothetical protein
MGNVTVKYLLKGKELSSEEVEQNRNMFDPRCFQSLGRLSAVLKFKKKTHDLNYASNL